MAAPPTADATAGADRRRTAADWLRTHRAIVILLLVPLAVFGVAQAFGWVFLDGDNFLQNFPMRVLVGRSIEHGELPLWNPYLFSGTPLLGGFNAGAAYPATWLMAVLPVFTAWTLNLTLAYDVALAGMYLFLRRQCDLDHGGGLRSSHLRLRRLHDGPDRAHRPDRGGGVAAVDVGGHPRPDRGTGPPGRPVGGGAGRPPAGGPDVGRPARRLPRAVPADRIGRGHHRRQRAGGHLRGGTPDHQGPCHQGQRPGPGHLPAGHRGRGGRRPRPRRRPVAAGPRVPLPVATGRAHLLLLHQRPAPRAAGDPDRLPVRARDQRCLRRRVQLRGGHQLRRDPGPHRRLLPAPQTEPRPTRGPPVADLVPHRRRRPAVGVGQPDALRPPPLPHPRHQERATDQSQSAAGRLLAGRPAGLVGPSPVRGQERDRLGDRAHPAGTVAVGTAGGDRGPLPAPSPSSGRCASSCGRGARGSSTSSTPCSCSARSPGCGLPLWSRPWR